MVLGKAEACLESADGGSDKCAPAGALIPSVSHFGIVIVLVDEQSQVVETSARFRR